MWMPRAVCLLQIIIAITVYFQNFSGQIVRTISAYFVAILIAVQMVLLRDGFWNNRLASVKSNTRALKFYFLKNG